jgi:hypothetical protein
MGDRFRKDGKINEEDFQKDGRNLKPDFREIDNDD